MRCLLLQLLEPLRLIYAHTAVFLAPFIKDVLAYTYLPACLPGCLLLIQKHLGFPELVYFLGLKISPL